jgi:hypothetical protein
MISPFMIPITGMVATAVTVIGFPIARAYAKRLEHKPAAVPPELAARLAHMEQAIDAIAVEVERISEGQRFTTKLLAERAPESLAPLAASAYQTERRA